MEFLNSSIEQLVTEIIAANHAWKEAKDLFARPDTPVANSLRDLKARLQVRLLRKYGPSKVYLTVDTNPNLDYEEPLYGLQLVKSVNGRKDAAHMPIRVAEKKFSAQELEQFVKR